jgi:hypothetical protein
VGENTGSIGVPLTSMTQPAMILVCPESCRVLTGRSLVALMARQLRPGNLYGWVAGFI